MPDFGINKTPSRYADNGHNGRVHDGMFRIGVIKRNDDFQKMGRLSVWIPSLGGDPRDEQHWFVVSYVSPFAGVSNPAGLVENSTDMEGSQTSYGWWAVPPDLENQVLVVFADGNTQHGFWIGCLYQQNMNHMVPGVASGVPTLPPDQQQNCGHYPPVVEYNKWSDENPSNPRRPVFKPLHDGLTAQGLYPDDERGGSSSSARREAPSLVYGYNTPRGNAIYVDDNPDNEFIRMRTRTGAQVLIHETTGYVYINSKLGNSWVEVSDRGVDIYSRGTISMRSEGSLNIHSDASLNIEADGNLNLRAGGNLTFQSAHHTSFVGNGNLVLEYGGTISGKSGGSIMLGAAGSLQMGAGGTISQASGGANIRNAPKLSDNDGTKAPEPATLAAEVEKPRDLPEVNGEGPCYQQDTRKTIVRRMPTHEPYPGHPKRGSSSTTENDSTEYASAKDSESTMSNALVEGNGTFTDDDLTWMTACLYTEANGLGDDMLAAVAQVVLNRVAINYRVVSNPWTGIKHQVLGHFQFTAFNASTNEATEKKGISIIKGAEGSASWKNCQRVAKLVMAGTYDSPAVNRIKANRRCVQYLNLPYSQQHYPGQGWTKWATPAKFVSEIGNRPRSHSFYLL
jgi:hypothetical protein